MSTPNFKKQSLFDLYATDDAFDDEPYFDPLLFQECKEYADKLNARLDFFNIDFTDGYYTGIQTYINPQTSDFDALDFLAHPQYYDTSDLFAEFGVNSYVLKRQILAEIKHINNDLLPELAQMYNFDKLHIVAQFSNGETLYAKENN